MMTSWAQSLTALYEPRSFSRVWANFPILYNDLIALDGKDVTIFRGWLPLLSWNSVSYLGYPNQICGIFRTMQLQILRLRLHQPSLDLALQNASETKDLYDG
mmetsp:Transcript_53904/g.114526  ORF Transcript_53904/g.114526 Transcript_53904/m.114526 type:complete len:102 (-) Transcript_53904:2315-2620(-)